MNTTKKKSDLKRICVIDGQGGGIGSAVIKKLKDLFGETVEIIALGTNAIATSQMLKAKANRGASGENAIVQTTRKGRYYHRYRGYYSGACHDGRSYTQNGRSRGKSPAKKLLIPLTQENVENCRFIAQLRFPHLIGNLTNFFMTETDKILK